ncbi:MAG: DUF3883 domain-containing protein [Thermofilaceae archaeon]|nr:DUF3883 domain-containing protein [Thermofilaceae archaeon]MCX8179788.1 DUF3883 domain-containing protein [Thermofilaceae archaeon]MDW8004315.1 DUF3883 domain-containing protein [Thermofilaceae archaeon]
MAVALAGRVLEIYARYNPVFYVGLAGANPPIEPHLHQVELLTKTMFRLPLRVFVADEIGLGKTVTAILLMKRLINLDMVSKVLILVPRILVKQWRLELERFGIRPREIERKTFQSIVQENFPDDIYVTSLDLAKRPRYADFLAKVDWDLVIVDEAHRLGWSGGGRPTLRFKFVENVVSDKRRNVLFLSATPHRGDPHDYLSRMRLLDPYLASDINALNSDIFYRYSPEVLIFRRTKMDVNDVYEGRKVFPDCKIIAIVFSATDLEREFHSRLITFLRTKILDYYGEAGMEPKALGLLNALIFKRASSSPYAAIRTMEAIISKRSDALAHREREPETFARRLSERGRVARLLLSGGFEDFEEGMDPDSIVESFAEACSALLCERDVEELRTLIDLARKCKEVDSRLAAALRLVKHHVESGEKVLVFTEFRDTAQYVKKALANELGCERVQLLTGVEANVEDKLTEVRSWLEGSGGRVLVATDVASEGLNLQVANVLVNYEPTWSPVKLEQRIGRVWRLGQKKNVTVYTMFLGVESDKDVLDTLYVKLIAMGRALGRLDKPPVGESAQVIDMGQRAQIPVLAAKREDRVSKVSEFRLIREYVERGRQGLDEIVEKMCAAIQQLQETMGTISRAARPDGRRVKEFMRNALGFSSVVEAEEAVKALVKALAEQRPDLVSKYREEYVVKSLGGSIVPLKRTWTALAALMRCLKGGDDLQRPVFVVAKGDDDREVRIYEVPILTMEGVKVYSEVVGVDDRGSLTRGIELLRLLTRALEQMTLEVDEFKIDDSDRMLFSLDRFAVELIDRLTVDYERYRSNLSPLRSCDDKGLLRRYKRGEAKLLAVVRFTREDSSCSWAEMSVEDRRRVEQGAMKLAMEYERSRGREPIDVSQREHYDIYSRDPKTREERFIEVKGHSGPMLQAVLTEAEYKLAKRLRERYWLYIVSYVGTERPQLIAIRDPLSKMRVTVSGEVRFVLSPTNRCG